MRKLTGFWAFLFSIGSVLATFAVVTPAWASGSTPASPATSGAVVVTGEQTPFGLVVFTAGARALYVLSFDTVGTATTPAVSTCGSSNGCTTAWPPLLAARASGPFLTSGGVQRSALGTILRSDGTYQVTYFGHPLYMFVQDTQPGQTNGENVAAFNGIWQLLTVNGQPDAGDATVSLETSAYGTVLDTPTAFSTFRSLYALTTDPPNQSTCTDGCATIWPPLLTNHQPEAGPGIIAGGLGTLLRADGTKQVTYFGHPVYLFAFDLAAGAPSGLTNGQYLVDSFAFGVWYLVGPSGRVNPGPVSVTSESSSLGTILAFNSPNPNSPGPFTLYAFSADTPSTSACTGACARAWPPLLTSTPPLAAAGSGVSQTGLGTIARPGGTFQVTYFGHPLYLFAQNFQGTSGEGITAFGGTFQVVTLAGSPE